MSIDFPEAVRHDQAKFHLHSGHILRVGLTRHNTDRLRSHFLGCVLECIGEHCHEIADPVARCVCVLSSAVCLTRGCASCSCRHCHRYREWGTNGLAKARSLGTEW